MELSIDKTIIKAVKENNFMNTGYISNLLTIALLSIWFLYIDNRIEKYQGETYIWKKLLGESENKILVQFQKRNILMQGLLLLAFAGVNISNNILIWIISVFNFIVLMNNIIMLVFRKQYHANLSGKIFNGLMYIYFIGLFFKVIKEVMSGGSAYTITVRITKSFYIRNIAEIIKKPTISFILINVVIYIFLLFTISSYNDRVCSTRTKKWIRYNINPPQNIIMFLIIYAGYIFLAVNISYNQNVFSVITCIFIILISGTIDETFHEDVCNKQWYMVLGEKYSRFLRRKIIVEIKIQSVIVITYFICALFNNYNIKTMCMVLMYSIICGIAWVTYFASYYINMQIDYKTLEMIKLYAIMIMILIPGINIILCLKWYIRGNKRWKKYVRD